MAYELTRENYKKLAEEQYRTAISCLVERKVFGLTLLKKDTQGAMLGFAHAEHLYRMAKEDILANMCKTNLRGLASSSEERDKIWLEGYDNIQNMLKNIAYFHNLMEAS